MQSLNLPPGWIDATRIVLGVSKNFRCRIHSFDGNENPLSFFMRGDFRLVEVAAVEVLK
jgi:hypothetical protein